MRPCTKDRITSAGSWYCADYALGFIAGLGAHPLDIAIWGMDSDKKGPISFRARQFSDAGGAVQHLRGMGCGGEISRRHTDALD